jgi:TolB-like protein
MRGQAADARSDIWALGVVLYELVAGQRPFQGKTAFELSSAILNQPVPSVPGEVPAPLAGVIERCLAKEPGERYQQAGDVQAALAAVEAGTAVAVSTRAPRRARPRLLASLAAALLVVVAGMLLAAFDVGGVRSRLAGGTPPAARVIRLAVLPFANISGDAGQDYVSDGLTTEMIALLGRLHPEALRVIARTTAMSYKKTDKPIDRIGRELGVDYILEGSAQREGGRIRITADLIKVADQTQLWAERYERELAGILVLQNDVAQQMAKALAKDPASARVYAGISSVWGYRRQMGLASAREAGLKQKAALRKAIELDDGLPGARAALAGERWLTDLDPVGAEREFRRAIELDPNDADARAGYSHVLMNLGQPDDAMRQIERAVAIDPLNPMVRTFYAMDLVFARRYDEALAQANQVLRSQPGHLLALSAVVYSQHMRQQYADAVSANAAVYAALDRLDVAAALKKGYAESGYVNALKLATEVELAKHGSEGGVAFDAGSNYAMAGDRARALDWLEKAFADRDPNMPYIGCMPIFDPLRSDPRFKALLRQMNLPR